MNLGLIYIFIGIFTALIVSTKVVETVYLLRRLHHYRRRLQTEALSNEELVRIQAAIDFIKLQPVYSSNVRRLCETIDREICVRINSTGSQERLWGLVK